MTISGLPGFQMPERMWQAAILAISGAVIILTVWYMEQGITTVFMHLYYIPIVLLAYHYRKKGIIPCVLLSLFYFTSTVISDVNNLAEIESAFFRVLIFIAIAVLVAYLSENLRDAKDNLEKSMEIQQGILQNANVWLIVLDKDGRIHKWNRAAEEMSGYTASEVVGKNTIWKLIYPEKDYRKEITRKISEIITKNNYLENLRTTITCRDGSKKIILWNTHELPHGDVQIPRYIAVGVDITDGTRAEEVLRESEAKYRTLFENMLEGFAYCRMIYDDRGMPVDWVYLTVNHSFERLTGLKNIEGKRVLEAIPDIRRLIPEIFDTYGRVAITGMPETFEIDFKPLGLWLKISVFSPEKGYFVAVFEDITDRKRAEEALRESDEKIRLLLNSAAEAIYGLDMNGNCTFCNNACLRLLGYHHQDDLLGKNMHWQIHAKHADGSHYPVEECRIFQAFRKGEGTHVDDEVFWRSDGTSFPAEYWSFPQRYNREIVGSVVTFLDITDRKRAEEQIRESRQRMSDIISFLPDPTFVIDKDGNVLAWNRAIEKLSGILSTDMIGKGDYEYSIWIYGKRRPILIDLVLNPDQDAARMQYTGIRREGSVIMAEVERIQASGKRVQLSVVASPLFDSQGKPAGAIESLRDITRIKKAETDLARLNAGLEKIVKDRTKALEEEVAVRKQAEAAIKASLDEQVLLLREVHHRVNNNLQIIISLTKLQIRTLEDPVMKQVLADTQNRVWAMSLVHEKLYQSENIASIELSDYTRYLATQLFSFYTINRSLVALHMDIDKIPLDIDTAIPLGLIMNELISNALKFAFPGGRTGTLSISGHLDGEVLTLVIKDDGVGLPQGFDWRNTESLGLRLITSLVDQIDGTIEKGPGEGTMFIITLHRDTKRGNAA